MNKIDEISKFWERLPFVYRINDGQCSSHSYTGQSNKNASTSGQPILLEKVCKERGWREFDSMKHRCSYSHDFGWNLWWRVSPMRMLGSRNLLFWQYTNHIPKVDFICNKEKLVLQLRSMEQRFGPICEFVIPKSYLLPKEIGDLISQHKISCQMKNTNEARNLIKYDPVAECDVPLQNIGDSLLQNSIRQQKKKCSAIWIYKPTGKSQGRGIVIVNKPELLAYYPNGVAQEYICRPLLIKGFKFDLRLYVVVVSTTPLTVYAYQNGLVRFATEKYDCSKLGNVYSHLTNASINKNGPGYNEKKDGIGQGCKWTFTQLRKYMEKAGIPDWLIWQKIINIVTLTITGEIDLKGYSPAPKNCFEFMGFDILIDDDYTPWLLEVNSSPGLGSHCDVDEIVKIRMLHEFFDLIGLPNANKPQTVTMLEANISTKEKSTPPKSQVVEKTSSEKKLIVIRPPPSTLAGSKSKSKINNKTDCSTKITSKSKSNLSMANDKNGNKVNCTWSLLTKDILKDASTSTSTISQDTRSYSYKKDHKIIKSALSELNLEKKDLLHDHTVSIKMKIINKCQSQKDLFFTSRFDDLANIYCGNVFPFRKVKESKNRSSNNNNQLDQNSQDGSKTKNLDFNGILAKEASKVKHRKYENKKQQEEASTSLLNGGKGKAHGGIQRKNWNNPDVQSGNWILIFPFDRLSQRVSRGKCYTKLDLIVNRISKQIKESSELTILNPNCSDDFYSSELGRKCNLTVPVWLPPK